MGSLFWGTFVVMSIYTVESTVNHAVFKQINKCKVFCQNTQNSDGTINRCHNELRGRLTRTLLDILRELDIGMYISVNHGNKTPISNEVLSETL